MKKYTLLLVGIAFVFGLFAINANLASAKDCAPGDLFNSTTGQRCTTTSTDASAYSSLKIGSRGELVRAFQQMLKDNGFLYGRVDGIYGRITDSAAKNYYKKYPPVLPIEPPCPLTANADGTITHVCPPTSGAPVISGVSGPQSLNVNQQGTWTVSAYDKNGGNLSYAVTWGDEMYALSPSQSQTTRTSEQSATFTHTYATAGIYKVIFTVTSENTIYCIKAPCPTNGGTATASLTVNVGNVTPPNNSVIKVLSPNGKETWTKGTTQMIKWQDSSVPNCPVGSDCYSVLKYYDITLKPTCVEACITLYRPDYTIATNVTGSSYAWSVGQVTSTDALPNGAYLMQVCETGTSNCDSSDRYFTIVSGTTNQVPNIISILPAGCNTNMGFSFTTGLPCSNPRVSASLGETVRVYGSNFDSSNYLYTYSSLTGDYITIPITIISSSLFSFVVPSNAGTGTHGITLKDYDNSSFAGTTASLSFFSGTTDQAPKITLILPAGCNSNMGFSSTTGLPCSTPRTSANFGETVNVFGSNFDSSNYLYTYSSLTGDYIAIPVNIISSTLFSFVVPSNAGSGTHGITLKDNDDTSFAGTTASLTFVATTTTQAPSLSYLSPTSGVTGTQVTLYGSGFTATGNKIKFGNSNSESNPNYNVSSNGTSITFTVPSTYYFACWDSVPACKIVAQMLAPGVYPVSVTNANGTSNTVNFTVTSETVAETKTPNIYYLSPAFGAVGTQVTIYGTNFSNTCTSTGSDYCRVTLLPNTIKFGSKVISSASYSDNGNTLSFVVPAELTGGGECSTFNGITTCTPAYVIKVTPGAYPVVVTNTNGTSNTVYFTVN